MRMASFCIIGEKPLFTEPASPTKNHNDIACSRVRSAGFACFDVAYFHVLTTLVLLRLFALRSAAAVA
jgi:hypothetical protein